jgi:hypothetical protein
MPWEENASTAVSFVISEKNKKTLQNDLERSFSSHSYFSIKHSHFFFNIKMDLTNISLGNIDYTEAGRNCIPS